MNLPEVGDRIRAGSLARVVRIEPVEGSDNMRCIVINDRGELGWIVYYAEGSRSNVNYFPAEQAEALRAELGQELEPNGDGEQGQ